MTRAFENCAAECGTSLEETLKIITVCPNDHKMHAECVNRMYAASDNPACPQCRDDTLSLLKDMIVKHPVVEFSDDDDFENINNNENNDSDSDGDDYSSTYQSFIDNTAGHITNNYYYKIR